MINVLRERPPKLTILGGYIDGMGNACTLLDIIVHGDNDELFALYQYVANRTITRTSKLEDFINTFTFNDCRTLNPPAGIILMRAKIEGDHQFLEALVDYTLDPVHREPVIMNRLYFESEEPPEFQSVHLGIRFLGSGGTMNFPLGDFWCQDGIELDELRALATSSLDQRRQFLGYVDGWTLARIQLR